jgi:chromosome segregation ATPase
VSEATKGGTLVQDLLVQVRELKVQNEKLRLEAREIRDRYGKPDPRLQRLEAENARLRVELAAAREERDELRAGVSTAVDALRKGGAR